MLNGSGFPPLTEEEARMYPPLALAYIGDGVYELLVRSYLTRQGKAPAGRLHSRAKEFVQADMQSRFADLLADSLTPREAEIFRRGRNAKPHTHGEKYFSRRLYRPRASRPCSAICI